MMNEAAAKKEGEILLRKLKGKGWQLLIWENLGWWCGATNGPLDVYGDSQSGYSCLLSDDPKIAGTGCSVWTISKDHSFDPNISVSIQVKEARKQVNKLLKVVEKAEEIIGVRV